MAASWRSANTGHTFFALVDHAGEPWMPEDASCYGWMEMVLVAHYMMGHCHLGPFEIPCEDELKDCPCVWSSTSRITSSTTVQLCGTYSSDGWMLVVEELGTCGG